MPQPTARDWPFRHTPISALRLLGWMQRDPGCRSELPMDDVVDWFILQLNHETGIEQRHFLLAIEALQVGSSFDGIDPIPDWGEVYGAARPDLNHVPKELLRLDDQGAMARIWQILCHKWPFFRSEVFDKTTSADVSEDPIPSPASNNRALEAVIKAFSGDNSFRIYHVAQDTSKTADERMRAIYTIDNRVLGWTSDRWSDVLGVSAPAVRQTGWWKTERPRLRS
jgi:hypothetical protein